MILINKKNLDIIDSVPRVGGGDPEQIKAKESA